MEDFDDRPGSVYDNLNGMNMPITATTMPTTMLTSTPKAKTTNGPRYRYDEIPFKSYDDSSSNNNNNNNRSPQKTQMIEQQRQQRQLLLPNGLSQSQQQQQQQQQQLFERLPLPQQQVPSPMHQQQLQKQLTEGKIIHSTLANEESAPAPAPVPVPQSTSASAAISIDKAATKTTANIITAAAAAAGSTVALPTASNCCGAAASAPPQRPLSQHSQSELNEASQSIAAVKAALNDAKSKFFGLNGYSQDTADTPHLLLDRDSQVSDNDPHTPTKLHILPVSHRQQPKYQNIPENSAIYRQQQEPKLPETPPSLPPKTKNDQSKTSSSLPGSNRMMATPSPAQSLNSPLSAQSMAHFDTAQSSQHSGQQQQSQKPQQQREQLHGNQELIPATAYRQLPVNDLDGPQPSQAVYMSTTVPQNIKGSKIAGRHTPTRNSLRHSRMLVVNNKNCQGSQHPNPMNFKYPNLARWLLVLQTSLAVLLIFLSIWIFFLAPNTAVQDNPYWSGLALLLTGVIGLVLIRYRRIKRHKVRENCFIFLRADSYLMSLVALLLCVVAVICAAIHLARLTANDTRCVSSNILLEHGSCACTFNAPKGRNTTYHDFEQAVGDWTNAALESRQQLLSEEEKKDHSYTVEYRDLSCQEVTGEWICVLGASIILNALGFLVSLIYIISLVYCRRADSKRFYSSVYTSTF